MRANKLAGIALALKSFNRTSVATALLLMALASCSNDSSGSPAYSSNDEPERGNPPELVDDETTTNDESNDQPLGYYGTTSVCVTSNEAGNTYTLDAEVSGTTVSTIYFARGGNVDFSGCDLDDNLQGDCDDDQGRTWTFEGPC